ncbi:MAG: gfo/Idh/MocA family oxidoreductase, partial [Robiginitalea sp.]
VARAIRGAEFDPGEFPTMTDGVRGLNFIEATVASHKSGNTWVTLD